MTTGTRRPIGHVTFDLKLVRASHDTIDHHAFYFGHAVQAVILRVMPGKTSTIAEASSQPVAACG